MYTIKPPNVYVTERVFETKFAVERMNRMMAHIECEEQPIIVSDAELNEIVKQEGWLRRVEQSGVIKRTGDPTIIFNAFAWRSPEGEREARQKYPYLAHYFLLGTDPWIYKHKPDKMYPGICQSKYEIHTAYGCLHACDYCCIQGDNPGHRIANLFLNIMLNLEEFVEHLDELIKENPWQKLYKYDNQTDTICFEPEYGASALLGDYFSQQEDKYLLLYTKSDNVDHLLKLDHNRRRHTLISWTISCETVSNLIEKKAPLMNARIEAAERCQEAGYRVRVRFSPIIPIRNWREENRAMIERCFTYLRPDLVTMNVLGWRNVATMKRALDFSLLDPHYRRLYEDIDRTGGKLPHDARAVLYQFFIDGIHRVSPSTRVSLCGESRKIWDLFGHKLGMSPKNFVCNCGSTSVPGNPLLSPVGYAYRNKQSRLESIHTSPTLLTEGEQGLSGQEQGGIERE